jgi:hypothetical protein
MIDFSQYFEYVWRAGEVEGGDVSIEWVVCVVCVACVVRTHTKKRLVLDTLVIQVSPRTLLQSYRIVALALRPHSRKSHTCSRTGVSYEADSKLRC